MLRIAVLRLSSLGDILLATPLLRQLRRSFPEAELVAVVRRRYVELLQANPRLTAVLPYQSEGVFWQAERERRQLRQGLRSPAEELWIVDLHRNWRTWYLRWGARARLLRAPKQRWRKLLLVWAKRWGWWRLLPVPERYRQAVAELGIEDDGEGLEFWLPEERSAAVYPPALRPYPVEVRRVALVPGARHATKRWVADHVVTLGRLLRCRGYEVVVVGDPADPAAERLAAAIAPDVECVRTPSLFEVARYLDGVDLVVANDTGLLHVAAARRIPVVALFCSTVPELGFAPVGVPSIVVQYPLPCRPCTPIGRELCPLGHFRCAWELRPEHVFHALEVLQHWLREGVRPHAPWGPTFGSGARLRT
ncbi:Lipopolysaccharide core heptosyltransferase RfaQ [bacterium HR21]|nr:Lipopolysaccharide core heptosyltransferase RfaQ [bacterium HR21]